MTTNEKLSFIDNTTRKVVMNYLSALDCPTSLGIYLCLKYHDDFSACSHSIDPNSYISSDEFQPAYLAAQCLSKFEEGPQWFRDERKLRAIETFISCESYISESASGFRSITSPLGEATDLTEFIYRARKIISDILGPLKDSFCIDSCEFGPGASTSVPGRKAHPSNKYIATDVSASCRPFVHWFFADAGISEIPLLVNREHSRITVVPKKFSKDRVIACEPDWNIFFQKGIGSSIRNRLLRVGLDLNNGAARHEYLALCGSRNGYLSTLDLSSASDTISTSLVRFLFPDDWFYFMNSTRTTSVELQKNDEGVSNVVPLKKFSSMGNGFTFELESLIFYALALSCVDDNNAARSVSVFGDDIIIPTDYVSNLKRLLSSCGFKLNLEKSYSSGYFRESCGAHFFDGIDCKPIFVKRGLHNDFEKFKFCNSVRNTANRIYHCSFNDSPLFSVYTSCRDHIRRVFYIPEGYGDGGLVEKFDVATPAGVRGKKRNVRRYSNCIEGYKVRCLLPVTQSSESETLGMYIYKLRRLKNYKPSLFLSDHGPFCRSDLTLGRPTKGYEGNTYFTRQSKTTYRIGFIYIPEWRDPIS